jgi:APA family basic amino acid/polyamine antiporter
MGKDGLLPSAFGKIHPKYQTPMLPTIITGVAAALLSGLLPIGTLGHMVSFGTLLAFAIVSLGILILRRTRPDLPRPFRTPWVPFVPIMGVLVSIGLIIGLEGQAKFWATAWILVGLAVYFLYSRHNSVLQNEAKARGE